MSLQLIVGRQGTDKSDYILREMKATLTRNPLGKSIYYIVPEQMTFQQEYALLQGDIQGSMRAQVVSFSRLAWHVLQETGGATKQFISSTGIQMMLRKIVTQRLESFDFFGKVIDKQGFITELEGIITEFKRHNVTPDMLAEQVNYATENVPLSNKLADLHYIYTELSTLLANQYIDGEDQLQLLVDKIPFSTSLEEAEIYIDGFYRFTPKEMGIIAALLKRCKKVTVTLIADDEAMTQEQVELDLFYQTTETYFKLQGLAKEQGVKCEQPIVLREESSGFEDKPFFNHLEKHFDTRPTPAFSSEQPHPITVHEAVHPRAELEGMIQEMLRLVRERGYRYNDFVIYLRETATYNDLIETMFAEYHIPVFIDAKRTMLNHPLVECIHSLFEVVESNWRYDAVFRLLKTGFIPATNEEYPLDADAIDVLENYVLEYGIRRKSQWLQTEKWVYQRFRGFDEAPQTDKEKEHEQRINAYRDQVTAALGKFDKQIRKRKSVSAFCGELYGLLDRLSVPKALETKRFKFEQEGLLEKSREEEQVWNGVIHLLDEMVEMIGEEEMDFRSFKTTYEAGLEALEFSHVPPSLDHVIVGTIDQSRIAAKKCVFLLGVNEGSWPMKPAEDGMINEQEREFLKRFGMELAESSRRILLDDAFYMYVGFTSAREYLWVSYVISDSDGKVKIPSPMIPRLRELFPSLGSPNLLQDPDELQMAERFITTKVKTRAPLTIQLARYLRGYQVEPIWWSVLEWYVNNEQASGTSYKVLQSLFYENTPTNLSKQTVGKLYQEEIKTSVSRLEMHYRCSYQHFAQYNLNLEDRRMHTLDAPNIGQLFHEAMKVIFDWVQADDKEIKALSKQDAVYYAKKSMAYLAPILQHNILSSSHRYAYIQRKLEEIIAQAMFILAEQARKSGFTPVGIELGFGLEEGLEALTVALPNGYELQLRGRIDRVDQFKREDELYLRIIDYKSSARGLDLTDVYYGLALQMLTYLHVVLTKSESWLEQKASPAGVLYFHLHKPMLSLDEVLTDEDIQQEILKKYKQEGLVLDQIAIAKQMDTSLESGYSQVAPIAITKKDTFYASAKVASDVMFDALQNHMIKLIKQAGIEITSGEIKLNPYEDKQFTACTFCSFKSVCQFDPILKENNYRKLPKVEQEDFLIKEEGRD